MYLNLPSPIHKLEFSLLKPYGCHIWIKRDDLIHPIISGNKYRKLHLSLQKCHSNAHDMVITFGGAYSNHLHATAYYCNALGIPSIGIVRGEYDRENATLNACRSWHMNTLFVSRSEYKQKTNGPLFKTLYQMYSNPIYIPEGGSNHYAQLGSKSIIEEISDDMMSHMDYVVLPVGTGGTISGILASDKIAHVSIIGIPVLRQPNLAEEIYKKVNYKRAPILYENIRYNYGRQHKEALAFKKLLFNECGLWVDDVYNAKALYSLYDMLKNKVIPANAHILYICTGGIQGSY